MNPKTFLALAALLCAGCASLPSDLRVARVTMDPDGVTEHAELYFIKARQEYWVVEGDTFQVEDQQYTVSEILPGRVVILKSARHGMEYTVPALTAREAASNGIFH